MEDKAFVWTSQLSKKFLRLRFENDDIFKAKKQPWAEFHKLLLDNGFPKEMTIDHVRKKWSYNYDMYKTAKRTNKKRWKYFKMFDKHFAKSKTLDKYDSWNDEWRLKLIECMSYAKEKKTDMMSLWRVIEVSLRSVDLPIECCIQDIQALWHHLKMTFNRKHRLKIRITTDRRDRRYCTNRDWPLYDAMLTYIQKYEPEYLTRLETEAPIDFATCFKGNPRYSKNVNGKEKIEKEFHWTKDITETFIQIRLQNDWLFRQKKWAWNELSKIMIQEYGFPKSLSPRELGRKWAATFSEYQKAKATNNTAWLYYSLFELYLGESNLSINPLVGWQEEWVFNLISARTDLEHLFHAKDQNQGWREVEKRLRSIGLPVDHSLLDLQEIWAYLLKTLKWKQKFANKGILNEQWPYLEAMTRYTEIREKHSIKKQKEEAEDNDHFADVTHDDDFEDDIKLTDLKKRLVFAVEPKFEIGNGERCRSCAKLEASVDVFEQRDDEGLDVAYKLKIIAGIEVERFDNLPSHICLACHEELQNAYKFRRKCQDVDKEFRTTSDIKVEVTAKHEDETMLDITLHEDTMHDNAMHDDTMHDTNDEHDMHGSDDITDISFEPNTDKPQNNKIKTKSKLIKKRKQYRYHYWKICEICGKHTQNLMNHLDAHTTDKAYSCDVCDKKFKFKSGLLIHKAVHDPTPKKTCEVCGKTFHILAQYRRHFVYHANERKYECETCGKRFNTLDILKVHIRTHTDERPFACEECGKTFRTAGCVSRHKRIVHRSVKRTNK